MSIGNLRKRIQIQAPTKARTETGSISETFSTVATVWGEIKVPNGKERVVADQLQAEISHKITIRYRTDVKEWWQLKYGGRFFRIKYIINPKEWNRKLQCFCKEIR